MPKARTNQEWLQELGAGDRRQIAAIEELRAILLRAATYTFQRNLGDLAHFSTDEIAQLAEDCAQEALIAILKHLSEFRGESKFTTWAYKFAINISLTMARRERWKGVSLDELMDQPVAEDWYLKDDRAQSDPEMATTRRDIWEIITGIIRDELTEKQGSVLKLIIFDEVPMDVVVQRLNSDRNAVYKLLHDARRKLKLGLQSHGFGVGEVIDLFVSKG